MNRKITYVDVGSMNPKDAEKYIRKLKSRFKNKNMFKNKPREK